LPREALRLGARCESLAITMAPFVIFPMKARAPQHVSDDAELDSHGQSIYSMIITQEEL